MSILCSMVGASFSVAAAAQVLRSKKSVIANGNAQIDTAQSKFGGASALFDGTGDYLSIAHHSSLSLADYSDWTIECWIRMTEGTSRTVLNKDGQAGTFYPGYTFYTNSSKQIIFGVGGSAGNWITVTRSSAIADNTWYHLAAVKNGSTVTFYVDGTSAGTATWVGYNDRSQPLNIGYETNGTYMYGHIDEVRISNSVRYTTTFTPSTSAFVNDANTLLLLHMNGTDAQTFFEDDNGIRASIGITGVNQTKISTAQSQFGGSSIEFDGTDDHLTVATLPTTTGDLTYELWGRFDILPWNQSIGGGNFMQIAYAGGGDYLIINRSGSSGSQVLLQVATGNRYGSFTKSGVNLAINTWYHIALVRSSGVWKAFFNGTELTTFINDSNFTNSGRTENVAYPQIGKFGDSRGSWDGYMDEIRFSNSARYTSDFTPPTTPFTNDANTLLLIHGDGTNNSTVFRDDNGALANRQPKSITAVGNAQVSTAQSKFGGSSLLLDGTGDYLNLSASQFNFESDFTVEGWIRPTADADTFFSTAQTGTSIGFWISTWTGASVIVGYRTSASGGAGSAASSAGVLTYNDWNHIAFSRSGTTAELYVNGTRVLNLTDFYNSNTSTVEIGRGRGISDGAWGASPPFEYAGHIDEVRVSNTRRYSGATSFTPSTTPFQNDANTVLLLHMDGANASTQFFDDTANRTQKGIQAIGNAQISTAQSQFGGSSWLGDGTGDYLRIANSNDFNFGSGNFTIEGWLRYSTTPNFVGLMSFATVGGSDGWNIQWDASGRIYLEFRNSANTGVTVILNTQAISANTWTHFAFTRSGNTIYAFRNGNLDASTTAVTYAINSSSAPLLIGSGYGIATTWGVAGEFNGYLDEVRISNIARYTAAFTPSTTPFQNDSNTLLLLHMDGTNASTVFTDDNGIAPYTP